MNISAPVFATVAIFHRSSTTDEDAYNSYFESFCEAAERSSGAYTYQTMMNDWSMVLLDRASPGDQSSQYIGLTPDPGIGKKPECSDFFPNARLYHINRQLCQGTWSITHTCLRINSKVVNQAFLFSPRPASTSLAEAD